MKEEEVARLLMGGATPVDLVCRRYARGTVYKVNKQLSGEGAPPSNRTDVETEAGESRLSRANP